METSPNTDKEAQTQVTQSDNSDQHGESQEKGAKGEPQKRKILGKFDSTEEVYVSYGNLERKLTEQSEKIKAYEDYEKQVAAVIDAVASDPDTLKKVQSRLGVQNQAPEQPSGTPTREDPRIQEIYEFERKKILDEFANRHGISSLPQEQKSEVFKKLGSKIGKWTRGRPVPSVDEFSDLLDEAWTLLNVDTLKEKGKAEGLASAYMTESAAISGIASSDSKSKSQPLTPEQKEVAKKLGISDDKYAESLAKSGK